MPNHYFEVGDLVIVHYPNCCKCNYCGLGEVVQLLKYDQFNYQILNGGPLHGRIAKADAGQTTKLD
jgi:hypothetical protein